MLSNLQDDSLAMSSKYESHKKRNIVLNDNSDDICAENAAFYWKYMMFTLSEKLNAMFSASFKTHFPQMDGVSVQWGQVVYTANSFLKIKQTNEQKVNKE